MKLQYDLEEQLRFNTQLLSENSERMVEMRMREDEITTVRDEVVKVRKLRDATMNKLKVTEAQKAEIEQQKEDLQGQISQLEKEKEIQRKLSESDKKRYEESIRERDVLTKMKAQVGHMSISITAFIWRLSTMDMRGKIHQCHAGGGFVE